jgi:hypothetical protein
VREKRHDGAVQDHCTLHGALIVEHGRPAVTLADLLIVGRVLDDKHGRPLLSWSCVCVSKVIAARYCRSVHAARRRWPTTGSTGQPEAGGTGARGWCSPLLPLYGRAARRRTGEFRVACMFRAQRRTGEWTGAGRASGAARRRTDGQAARHRTDEWGGGGATR